MGFLIDRNKNTIDEKRYKQILAEEELEEKYFNREHSFKKMDEKKKKEVKEEPEEIVEEYVDNTDYDEFSNDYYSFNKVKEDYDNEDSVYIDVSENEDAEKESFDEGYTIDRSAIVSIVSNIYKWIVIIAAVMSCILILYLLIKAKFISVILYIISLICSFLFGYVVMFAVNYLFFRE